MPTWILDFHLKSNLNEMPLLAGQALSFQSYLFNSKKFPDTMSVGERCVPPNFMHGSHYGRVSF